MDRFKKIQTIHLIALVYIWVDLAISLILSLLFFLLEINIYLSLALSLVSIFIISCLLAFVGLKLLNLLLSRMNSEVPVIAIKSELSQPNISFLDINENIRTYYWIKRHLNTITIYNVETIDSKNCKSMFKKSRKIIKKNIPIANEIYSRERHRQLEINVLMFSQNIDTNEGVELIRKINNSQLYELGKFTVGYIKDTKNLLIKTYDSKQINFIAFNRYRKSVKFLCKYFGLPYKEIICRL